MIRLLGGVTAGDRHHHDIRLAFQIHAQSGGQVVGGYGHIDANHIQQGLDGVAYLGLGRLVGGDPAQGDFTVAVPRVSQNLLGALHVVGIALIFAVTVEGGGIVALGGSAQQAVGHIGDVGHVQSAGNGFPYGGISQVLVVLVEHDKGHVVVGDVLDRTLAAVGRLHLGGHSGAHAVHGVQIASLVVDVHGGFVGVEAQGNLRGIIGVIGVPVVVPEGEGHIGVLDAVGDFIGAGTHGTSIPDLVGVIVGLCELLLHDGAVKGALGGAVRKLVDQGQGHTIL